MIITFHKDFKKVLRKFPAKTQEKFYERLSIFEKDVFNPALNNHALRGNYSGYRSINITGDLRALYKSSCDEVIFVAIDSHSNLYG